MYAPFHAVFTWYSLFFLRAAVDDDRHARWILAALTVVGVLTWEGGVLLAATNLMLPFVGGRGGTDRRADWTHSTAMGVLAIAAYVFATTDFRQLDPSLVYPEGFDSIVTTITPGWREVSAMIGPVEQRQWIWMAAALLPLGVSALAIQQLWQHFRNRWMAAAGLATAVIAGALHHFAVSGLVLALIIALGLLRWQEFTLRPVRACMWALALWLAGWLAYGLTAADWSQGSDTTLVSRVPLLTLAYNLLAFPDVLLEIAKPWGAAVPRLSLAIGLAITGAVVLAGRDPDRLPPDLRIALFLVLLLIGGAAASDPPRHETRYVFFLYPLAVILLLTMLGRLVSLIARTPARTALILPAAATLFVATEDTAVREVRNAAWLHHVPAALLPPTGKGHLIHQADSRSAARWLGTHVNPMHDVVINASPGVDFYYRDFDFAYIDWTQQRFLAYACDRGRRERWGNQRLLYTKEALRDALTSRRRGYVVASSEQAQVLRQDALHGLRSRVVHESPDTRLQVIEVLGTRP